MKILKKNEHALLVKPFGVKDTLYLAATVLIFFDLENPDDPLTEQDLWSTIPGQLGDQGVLDMGMAKPRGEVLVTGSCHTAPGADRTAAQVSLRVGALEKRLHVFGNRYWKLAGGVTRVISDPEPFSEIPIVYENAFGGHGHDKNPVGKGMAPVVDPNGQKRHPLPNIEDPGHLIGAAADRPDPAGFGPLDPLWPQRAKKQGTYDQPWLLERWPYFPEDMDYEFFNTAPEDQFISGFFQGEEPIEIVNMHPDVQYIRSHLPPLRIRCFATKKTSLQMDGQGEDRFEEVPLHIDTVHLFPSILRGVVMYRGTTQILDDEYADVRRIFLATEKLAEEPKSIEFYFEAQQKALDRTVPIDRAPLEAARKKIGDVQRRIRSLPKEIHEMRRRAMGKAPRMPAPTPAEMVARAATMTAGHAATLDKLEAMARDMRTKWGHLAPVPLDKFDDLRTKLRETEQRIAQARKTLDGAQNKGDALKQEIAGHLKAKARSEDLAEAGIDPDDLLKPEPVNPWHDRGFPFVVQCRQALARDRETREKLLRSGLTHRTLDRTWLGINPAKRRESKTDWGLVTSDQDQEPDLLCLPAGVVLPGFEGEVLNRIRIFPDVGTLPGGEVLIEGSDQTPLFLPAACLIELPGVKTADSAPCVRVADELQALLVEQEAGDACSVIVLKQPGESLADEAAQAIAKAPVLLVVSSEPGMDETQWTAWQKTYPNAVQLPLPAGRTVFEAAGQGTDIRAWVMAALPPDLAAKHKVAPETPLPDRPSGKKPPAGADGLPFDIKSLVTGLMQEVRDFHQPKFDALKQAQKEGEDRAREAIAKAGKNPDEVLAASAKQPSLSLSQAGDTLAGKITQQRDKLKDAGRLPPELEERMNTQAAEAVRMGREGETRLAEGTAKIEAAKRKAENLKAGQIPGELQAAFDQHGIDPEKMKQLTREEVIARHARGEPLAGVLLNGLDLSGLDLRGVDLSRAQCRQTKFCGSDLSGADLSRTLAQEADFSKAVLQEVRSDKGVFSKASFRSADLRRTVLRMAVLQEADLSEADCTQSDLYMSVLEKAKLKKTNFSRARINMSVFTSAQAVQTDFSGAHLSKCLFQKARLDQADFSESVVNATMFYGAEGEAVRFCGADLGKSRMGGQTVLAGADFSAVRMTQGCFRDSDLSGADFRGARIEGSLLESCDLSRANLANICCLKSRLAKSNLEGANLRGVNLFLGSLRKARLVNTDLRGANLYGVDFYKAVMGGTRLEGANLKMTLIEKRTDYLP